ncbi:histidine utilization repressor [Neptunicella marina]|uniref:Histidine utilization repressor n=1 Tax=Neptunicella marina TaxID=2125989 RepID=A0A8J6M2R4_9ALTE|nr:histidine utilization repressor [Neptunicella marina]MBC3766598.1 histidine utilization repressor [Neptunicella marina]
MASSKYQTIKTHILEQVKSGQWPENHVVPSENQLAKDFSVSRMTARRALQELADQGVLIRNQGAATVVASLTSQSSVVEIRNIADEISDRDHIHKSKVMVLSSVKADRVIANALNIDEGTEVAYSCICHFEDDKPVQLEQRYISPAYSDDYLQQDFSQMTPHSYLCKVAPLTEATHQIEAILPNSLMQWSLDIDAVHPCLHVHRHTWSTQGIVSYALLTHPGHRYRLGGHITFPTHSNEN